jgi:erythronate-4-phosphate dehydrogenase
LLDLTALGSPHIAGYSYDGKVRGMTMLYEAVCRFLDIEKTWSPEPHLSLDRSPYQLTVPKTSLENLDALVRCCYDIRVDDTNLRRSVHLQKAERGVFFDSLRRGYRLRREFTSFPVSVAGADEDLTERIRCLGFQTL